MALKVESDTTLRSPRGAASTIDGANRLAHELREEMRHLRETIRALTEKLDRAEGEHGAVQSL